MNRLMSVEKNWHFEKYVNKIYDDLTEKEKKRIPYFGRSKQMEYREDLVYWVINTSNQLGFNINIKHLAVYLLDIFLDNHEVLPKHLKIVASCCLILAAKVEDAVDPMNKKFNEILGNKYDLRDFVKLEMSILTFFNYNVMFAHTVNFMEFFSIFTVHPTDMRDGQRIDDFEVLNDYANKYIAYFMDRILVDTSYYRFAPSLVAAAIIWTTRHCLSLTPEWPLVLLHFTGYRYDKVLYQKLFRCTEMLKSTLNADTIVSITRYAIDPINAQCCNSVCRPLDAMPDSPVEYPKHV